MTNRQEDIFNADGTPIIRYPDRLPDPIIDDKGRRVCPYYKPEWHGPLVKNYIYYSALDKGMIYEDGVPRPREDWDEKYRAKFPYLDKENKAKPQPTKSRYIEEDLMEYPNSEEEIEEIDYSLYEEDTIDYSLYEDDPLA